MKNSENVRNAMRMYNGSTRKFSLSQIEFVNKKRSCLPRPLPRPLPLLLFPLDLWLINHLGNVKNAYYYVQFMAAYSMRHKSVQISQRKTVVRRK